MHAAAEPPALLALAESHALVIDPNAAARTALAAMLRSIGVGRVELCGRIDTARQLMRERRFDILVCEHDFPAEPRSGLDLIDDLRAARSLLLSTVVIMVSGEAGALRVSAAAEAAVDAYVLKPHTERMLQAHLLTAHRRKQAIRDICAAVAANEIALALSLCEAKIAAGGECWLNAARIAAELHLKLGQSAQALALFDAIFAARALPWARLGIARAQYQSGDLAAARRTLDSLLVEQPGYADAYDALARILVDQCEFDQALAMFRRSCALSPGSPARWQKLALLAVLQGSAEEAGQALEHANRLAAGSPLFDCESLVLGAALQYDSRKLAALAATRQTMTRALARQPASERLRRFDAVIGTLDLLARHCVPQALAQLQQLFAQTRTPGFDLEAACNLLLLLSRVARDELRLESAADIVEGLAKRFADSAASTEMLCRMARSHAPFEEIIRAAHAQICADAEDAIMCAVDGDPQRAVEALLLLIERTMNGKLIALADKTLARHREQIGKAAWLAHRLRGWQERCGQVSGNGESSRHRSP